jgi:Zn-dependent protease
MLGPAAAPPARACARCATELPELALACPACSALVHRARLEDLAARAAAAATGSDRATARALWEEAQALVPVHSEQHRAIGARLAALADDGPSAPATTNDRGPWLARALGAAVTLGLLLAGKLKFLVLGLGKMSTLMSMFGFIGVYWAIHGWPLAAGLAVSIYIHETGHVAMLRRLGIRAGAPLFVPGVGAFVMLKQPVTDPVVDARIGLAGPVWGLSAAIAAGLVYLATGAPLWLAIADLTAFLNLFNLIPIWQLDGARAFHALSRTERLAAIGVIALALAATGVRMLWIVGAVAAYRAGWGTMGPGHAPSLATFAVLVLALAFLARSVG